MAIAHRFRVSVLVALLAALAAAAPACGGGAGGGFNPTSLNPSLALVSFYQANVNNVPINRKLRFTFSEPVDMNTIGHGSIQIRKGSAHGETAAGEFIPDPNGDPVSPTTVYFEPKLPNMCQDYSETGLVPGTTYKVTVIGYPEQFAIRNAQGQPLVETTSYEFGTRPESDPEFMEDQIPGQAPAILQQSPADGRAALPCVKDASNEIVIDFTENLDPCSVTADTFKVHVYEWGTVLPRTAIEGGVQYPDGSGVWSGFVAASPIAGTHPAEDQFPDNVTKWGNPARPLQSPQEVPGERILEQDYYSTQVRFVPAGGRMPENALIVVELTFDIVDFGKTALTPTSFSFTTENLQGTDDALSILFDTEMVTQGDVNEGDTTADVDTARSPSLAQGWMLFAGGGDNGVYDDIPYYPVFSSGTVAYQNCDYQVTDGFKDHFLAAVDRTIHTGRDRVPDTCLNETDGSTAVLYDYRTFTIADGVVVTVIGENPAIFRVQGDVQINPNAELRVRGGDGESGHQFSYNYNAKDRAGGIGYAGAGDGGIGQAPTNPDWSDDGYAGYGSPDQFVKGGQGAGEGGVGLEYPTSYSYSAIGQSGVGGGGGGHAADGQDGGRVGPLSPYTWAAPELKGMGGGIYPDTSTADEMLTPSAGSGGGGGGWTSMYNNTTYYYYAADGGAGGAGGGFVDFTSQGDIRIFGLIDAQGGAGGNGGVSGYTGGGGGGGGSGGGVRLLTPARIDVTGGSILTTGGRRGAGNRGQYATSGTANNGGAGGHGRIVLEDGDSVITGLNGATLVPTENQPGFHRGIFQSTRFSGGAGASLAATMPLLLPGQLIAPVLLPLEVGDFDAAIPAVAARGPDGTSMVVEMRGWPMLDDGSVGLNPSTPWYCVGHFRQGDTPTEPKWYADTLPPDATTIGYDNTLTGIANLSDVSGYVEVRIFFFTPSTNYGPTDPGPYVDDMRIRYNYDH